MRTDSSAGLVTDLCPGRPALLTGNACAVLPSVFQLLAVYWHDCALEAADLRERLSTHWINNASIFHVPEPPRLRSLLGCTLSQWEIASGSAYLGGVPAKLLLATHLRYCRQCLTAGWHSALFQHIAVTSCPLHGTRLRQGCLRCNQPISLEPASIASHQNFCPHCSFPFAPMDGLRARREVGPGDPAAFARLAAALMPDARAELTPYKSDLTAQELLDAGAAAAAVCAAHRCWSESSMPGTRWFAQETRVVAAADRLPVARLNHLAHRGQSTAFEKIRAQLSESGAELEVPSAAVISSLRGGARMDWAIPTCSAAYIRTVLALEMQEVLPDRRPIKDLTPLYTEWLPMYEDLAAATAASQVYNLYVLNLVQLRRVRHAVDVAWNWTPHPAAFSPPWRLWRRGDEMVFELRQRASGETLARLVRRYAHRRLQSTPQRASR